MKSLILLGLFNLPSTLALAVHARQQNATATIAPTSTASLPILPPPGGYTQVLVAPNCARWDKIGFAGIYNCDAVIEIYRDMTLADLVLWNPSVGPSCDSMWYDYWFCSAISGPAVPLPVAVPGAGVAVHIPVDPPATQNHIATCDRWDQIPGAASCGTFMSLYPGLTLTDLQTWNPSIVYPDRPCLINMNDYLCTSVVGHVFPIPGPIKEPGVPTGPHPPGVTQAGATLACMKWAMVEYDDRCGKFVDMYDITIEDFVSWNPSLGPECTGLWGGYAVCVGI